MKRHFRQFLTVLLALAGCATPHSTVTPAPARDIVRLTNNTFNDNAVVLVDGRRNPNQCRSDEIWRGSANIVVNNLRSPGPCNSEVVVFSNHHAMQLVENAPWTDPPGDIVTADLKRSLDVPITVWAVQAPFQATQTQALTDVARGNVLYGTMNCGIQLAAMVTDATTNPNAPNLLVRRCDQATTLRSQIGFTPGRINVYYIAEVRNQENQTGRGAWCGSPVLVSSPSADDMNTILISTSYADNETLAHEIGHAFSLDHTNAFPNIPNTNLMHGAGIGRNSLTEGQCFRCNVNPHSAMNRNGIRIGPTRPCPDGTVSDRCPALSLDVSPNN